MTEAQIPRATYRLQFNRSFTFQHAAQLVPYLAALGISHCYASPYLRARPGSMHGYDIIDHNSLNPEVGTPEDFDRFIAALHEYGMGQILDIVPNHMGVMGSDNVWWLDVLENGEASHYADFFDIDWQPIKDELQGKVLTPVLGDQYGNVLDRGDLKLTFDPAKGEFSIVYFQHRFPVNPKEYPRILNHNLKRLEETLGPQDSGLLELQSLIAAFGHLPGRFDTTQEKRAERARDKEIHKRRLAALCTQSAAICEFIETSVQEINGRPGDPQSFDELHELIKVQAYRLAYWRVASDDINHRRFFDVNDLAGIRMENSEVFEITHRFVLQLLHEGKLNGLRIDHPDGLYNPAEYFHRLQCGQPCPATSTPCETANFYVVIEKILTGDETLPESWPVSGTTGYDFLNLVNGLFVDPNAASRMDRTYRAFVSDNLEFDQLAHECKKLVMDTSLASELNVLANLLSQIALANRHTCDFTTIGLRDALSEIIACFAVYRTYVTEERVSESDRRCIELAVSRARLESSIADPSVFDFIRGVLLTEAAEGHTKTYRRAVFHFAMKIQQFTSVVMAKGMEDTTFYRYNRLVSLNEVGGDPRRFGVTPDEFHQKMEERSQKWPYAMSATSTHDTKRSEDVRARINVLSEFPALWRRNARRWRQLNLHRKQIVNGCEAPSRNHEYLLYQTLIGAWPLGGNSCKKPFVERMKDYMLKAVREAKDHTSWSNRNAEYESAVSGFVEAILDSSNTDFLADFLSFQKRIARLGMFNSLSQLLIKLTATGVPDIYQGTELWDFSLVDPDNRRSVDYAERQSTLEALQRAFTDVQGTLFGENKASASTLKSLVEEMEDSHIKLFVSWRTLSLRKRIPGLFRFGEYIPHRAIGQKAEHLVAYARRYEDTQAIVVVPRLLGKLLGDSGRSPSDPSVWGDTRIPLSPNTGSFQNIFTAGQHSNMKDGLEVAELLADFPIALLVSK